MKKSLCLLLLLLSLLGFSSCKTKGNGEVCLYWKGYISIQGGNKTRITINFIGQELKEGKAKVLKATKLTIKGDNFTKNIEFKSPDGEKTARQWVFATKSSNLNYPYGVVSISTDYKNINGQIPDQETISTFYSEDD